MDTHEKVMELALRRGFIWPSFEVYGGVSGFYDYGPLGATLKKKIEDKWRQLYCIREGFFEISSPTIAPEEVFIASGHVESFVDPMVECRKCGSPFRADHLISSVLDIEIDGLSFEELDKIIKENKIRCPECGGELSDIWSYNLMFKTHIGPGEKKVGYLRPETAQGMFLLFNRLYSFYRKKLPFGVAQLGRAYRNEISPRQGVIRLREFSQAEVEVFVDPREKTHSNFSSIAKKELTLVPQDGKEIILTAGEAVEKKIIAHQLLAYHLVLTMEFLLDVGIPRDKIRFRQHKKTEMAHYAADCWDAEVYTDRFGWIEVVGIADRTCYDLEAHERMSKTEFKVFKQFKKPKKIKKKVLVPKMEKLGPTFKENVKEILEKIEALQPEDVKKFAQTGYVEIVVNNKPIRLDKEYLDIKDIEESILGEKITPHVIEPSYGIDRILYCILETSYTERDGKVFLKLKNSIAPIEVAVFPLISKPELVKIAKGIYETLREDGFYSTYDENDSIGRRYARIDEIGVPYAITVDFDTLKDKTVTLRDRDTTEQIRIRIDDISKVLRDLLCEKETFESLKKK
jgi:glycyl-tRNA synthetase